MFAAWMGSFVLIVSRHQNLPSASPINFTATRQPSTIPSQGSILPLCISDCAISTARVFISGGTAVQPMDSISTRPVLSKIAYALGAVAKYSQRSENSLHSRDEPVTTGRSACSGSGTRLNVTLLGVIFTFVLTAPMTVQARAATITTSPGPEPSDYSDAKGRDRQGGCRRRALRGFLY
jgi:hypothetical protein